MKSRVLKKLLDDTGYQVSDHGDYIAVGSGMCHNLISVDKATLKVAYALDTFGDGRKAIKHKELTAIWDKLHELIASGKIQDIIEGCDDIANPLPVYTVEDGQLIETTTDEYGWPNVTVDGRLMYDNTHFKTRDEAVAYGVQDMVAALRLTGDNISRAEKDLAEMKERRNQYVKHLNNLKVLGGGRNEQMSGKYKDGDRVPSDVLCKRLKELSHAVTEGEAAVNREFNMRIPAELDHDADLILSEAAKRIETFENVSRYVLFALTGSNDIKIDLCGDVQVAVDHAKSKFVDMRKLCEKPPDSGFADNGESVSRGMVMEKGKFRAILVRDELRRTGRSKIRREDSGRDQ